MTAGDVNVPLPYRPTAVSGFSGSRGFEHYAAITPQKSDRTDVAAKSQK